jgi:uncharacterized membrane protein YjgN (DUF898 family)
MNDGIRVEPYLHAGEPPPAPPAPTPHRPEFRGQTGEFFGIWIVNLVLTVLTLGIYSAWAKVRTQRYFYSNTRLAGAPFEYLADPITILKGRLIAYAFMIAFVVSAKLQIFWVLIPLYLVILALFPWLIFLGMRFRARYSSWRGLRFRFTGTVGNAYINYMLLPIAAAFTMYLLVPWVQKQQQEFMVSNHSFGGRKFDFQGELGKYYRPFWIAFGCGILLFIGFFVMMLIAVAMSAPATEGGGMPPLLFVPIVLMYAGFFAIPIYLRINFLNLRWQNTSLGGHRFESTLEPGKMIWIYFSNGLAILATLGLAVPWAMIRMARYRAANLVLLAEGSLDDFVAQVGEEQSAAGAELAGALDLDLDIAL